MEGFRARLTNRRKRTLEKKGVTTMKTVTMNPAEQRKMYQSALVMELNRLEDLEHEMELGRIVQPALIHQVESEIRRLEDIISSLEREDSLQAM